MTSLPEPGGPDGHEIFEPAAYDKVHHDHCGIWQIFRDIDYSHIDTRPNTHPPGTHRPEDLWSREQ